jgi:hypothetical protein
VRMIANTHATAANSKSRTFQSSRLYLSTFLGTPE